MKLFDKLSRLYQFYTSDLNYKEVEKLIKQDLPELYSFYVNKMKRPQQQKKSLRGLIIFIRDLFVEFLYQLSPIRRVIYTTAVIFFIYGIAIGDLRWSVVGFLVINILLAFELADKLIAKDELAVAWDIQNSLMPKVPPSNQYYEISCYSQPAREVGGDYYDFINRECIPGKTYVIIGDISGKGMAAAIHMVQVQAILHYLVENYESPKIIISLLNKNLKKVLRKGSFFTVSLACLNSNGAIHFVRAGHLPLIHYSHTTNELRNIIPKGMGIGLSHDSIFETSLEEVEINPCSGDIIILYTDGVIEAMNSNLQEFGEERLKSVITKNMEKSAKVIHNAILESVSSFTGNAPAHDDLTLIVMKYL